MLTLIKMLIIKPGYQRKYQVGGFRIFSKLKDFLSKFISKKQVVDSALNIARSAGQKVGQKFRQKAIAKLTPKSQEIFSKLVATHQESQLMTTPNLNNLIAGSGQTAIKIQDLVKRLNEQNQ